MKETIVLITSFLLAIQISGQPVRKMSLFINVHGNKTIYDRVIPNNDKGAGLELGFLINTKTKLRPKMEFDYDLFMGNDKGYLTADNMILVGKRGVPCVFIGDSYFPIKKLNTSLLIGASFFNSDVYFAIKPSIGFYLDNNQRFEAKIALTNIFGLGIRLI
jgi:hypothetical protein